MAFRQECKFNFVVGKKIKLIYQGLEYEGTVVKYEYNNLQDAHVKLLNDETGEHYVLPVNHNMVIIITAPESTPESEISENDLLYTKKKKK